jgi:hypothetical protein
MINNNKEDVMTALMVKMIVADLRNRVRESGAGIAAMMIIAGALIGLFVPGEWWTSHPVHAPVIEQNHPFENWDVDTKTDKPSPGYGAGALTGMNVFHCMTTCP